MIVVSDTSPITALLSIGQIDLLHSLYGRVVIPPAVQTELKAYHSEVPEFIETVPVQSNELLERLGQVLDPGEAEAIVLAKEIHSDLLLMDETLGRQAARHEHLSVIGLMGVLLIAKKKRLVASVGDLMNLLESEAGFYLARSVKEQVLHAADE